MLERRLQSHLATDATNGHVAKAACGGVYVAGSKYSYYLMLRALGAWLDEESPRRFTALETVDGFSVVLTGHGSGRPEISEVHFDRETLTEREKRLVERHRILGNPFGTAGEGGQWHLAPSGRQDFLRALGYELDDADASGVILDELDDQLILTYSYVDPVQGYLWHKRLVQLHPEEISKILDVARERRKKERKGVLRW
jgi:hypothetical protein